MLINEQLEKLKMTKYRLSKESGVPQATINDICNGKTEQLGTIHGGFRMEDGHYENFRPYYHTLND